MPVGTGSRTPVATVDVKQLSSVRWGPMRQLFPAFVEDLELGRYLKRLLAETTTDCQTVQLEPHRDAQGRLMPHVIDVFLVEDHA
jgi:hypothetical protein